MKVPEYMRPFVKAAKAVERGAAWADEHRPEWVDDIDLDQLRMCSGRTCILGQIARALDPTGDTGYWDVAHVGRFVDRHGTCITALLGMSRRLTGPEATELGFTVEDSVVYDYGHLDVAWTALVRDRRASR